MKEFLNRILFRQKTDETEDITLPSEIRKIADVIGRKAAIKLWKAFAGRGYIHIPTLQSLDTSRKNRDEEIVKKYNEGTKVNALAAEYKLSARNIYLIIKKAKNQH